MRQCLRSGALSRLRETALPRDACARALPVEILSDSTRDSDRQPASRSRLTAGAVCLRQRYSRRSCTLVLSAVYCCSSSANMLSLIIADSACEIENAPRPRLWKLSHTDERTNPRTTCRTWYPKEDRTVQRAQSGISAVLPPQSARRDPPT